MFIHVILAFVFLSLAIWCSGISIGFYNRGYFGSNEIKDLLFSVIMLIFSMFNFIMFGLKIFLAVEKLLGV